MSGGEPDSRPSSAYSPPAPAPVRRPAVAAAGRPPGPRGRLLVGTLFDYEKDPLGYLASCRDRHGDIFSLTPYHVVLCRPDWGKEVFARTNHELRLITTGKTGRESFMAGQITGWMHARRSAAWRKLGPDGTAASSTLMRERLQASFERMAARPDADVLDCQQAAADAAMHIFVADADAGERPGRLGRLVADAADTVPAITGSSLDLPAWASPSRRKFLRATTALVQELTTLAEQRSLTLAGRDDGSADVLDLLCSARDESGTTPAFTSLQIAQFLASSLTNLYSVGGAVLSWLMVMVARYPRLAANRGAEGWADAVVKETLRVYPPIWSLIRLVSDPVEFGGYRIEPGMSLIVSPKLMHADPRWWREDPAVFSPERWLGRQSVHDGHAYIPYGSGPRVCVGAQIGQALLIQAFDLLTSGWQVSAEPSEPLGPPTAIVIPDPVRFTLTSR